MTGPCEQHSSGYDVGDTARAAASNDALGAALDVQVDVGATHPEVVGARAETSGRAQRLAVMFGIGCFGHLCTIS